ncbi:hypothetical protein Daus18300_002955 [Diaporthe australafricana]|uniref:Uncharacterized protein n=1 Tax=Diaporthe australafricana TaxID=127596 RepID=A0ABR3XKR0_9PEZI
MRAFAAIFAIGAILGTALATPIGLGDAAVERRDDGVENAARQFFPPFPLLPTPALPTLPAILPTLLPVIPTFPTPVVPPLVLPTLPLVPGLPPLLPITVPTSPADLGPTLTNAVQQIVTVLSLIRAGLPTTPGLPALPTLPLIPGLQLPLLPAGTSPSDFLSSYLAVLQAQLAILQTIFNNLPAGASLPQLQDALGLLGGIQGQVTPVLDRINALIDAGTIQTPGNFPTVETTAAFISTIINVLTTILGPLLGLLPPSDFGR